MNSTQLPLPLRWAPEFDLNAFFFADRATADMVRGLTQLRQHQAVLLLGPANSGKSYLLHALHAAIAGAELAEPGAPTRSETPSAYLVDNLEAWLGDAGREEWLFHDFNRALDQGRPWIASARSAPAHLKVGLADLASRLTQSVQVVLPSIVEPETRFNLLRQQAAALGAEIGEDVLEYLETHVSRDLSTLSQWITRLNEFSLARGRKITRHTVRELLKQDQESRHR